MKKVKILFFLTLSNLVLTTTNCMEQTTEVQKEKKSVAVLIANFETAVENLEKIFNEAYDLIISEESIKLMHRLAVYKAIDTFRTAALEFYPYISQMPLSSALKNKIGELLPTLIPLISPPIVELLLALGVPTDVRDRDTTPLLSACWGRFEWFHMGYRIFTNDNEFESFEIRTFDRQMSATVQLLIEAKADIHQKDDSGQNLAHLASYQGFNEVLKVLINHKINIKHEDNYGDTPLIDTASNTKINAATLKTLLAASTIHTKQC